MELRHLRHFIAVAEELHFARAADRLGMAQPPLSHSIRNLEIELGVRLFHRTTRQTWLTRAGGRFYIEAVRILEQVEIAKTAARDDDGSRSCRLDVGLTEAAAGEPFTRFLFELEHRTPLIRVEIREPSPAEVTRLLLDRVLDVVIALEPVEAAGLRSVRAWSERLSLLAPLGHVLADRDCVALADLSFETFVMPSAAISPGYAAQLDELFTRLAVMAPRRVLAKHQNTMISFAATGRGLALLPESIAHGLTSVVVIPLAELDAEMVSWLCYRDEDPSEAVSFSLELASTIDSGERLPSGDGGRT